MPFPAPSPVQFRARPALTVSLSPQSLSPQERAAYKEHISNVSVHGALLCWILGGWVGWGCQNLGAWGAGSLLGELWRERAPPVEICPHGSSAVGFSLGWTLGRS